MKRQTITIGSFIQLKLPCNLYAYGRIVMKLNYAFYDIFSETEIPVSTSELAHIANAQDLRLLGGCH